MTVGESLIDYQENLVVKTAKDNYFYYLSQNFILDISTDGIDSQMKYLGEEATEIIRKKYTIKSVDYTDHNIPAIITALNKVLLKVRTMLDSLKPKDTRTRYIKNIYERIASLSEGKDSGALIGSVPKSFNISIHIDRPHLFNKNNRANFPEASYVVKFWGPVLESFFYSNDYDLQWIVVMSEDEAVVDGATTEIAKKASPKKLFNYKLKAVLGTKCHLNNFLATIPHIDGKDIKHIVIPIIQIMAFDLHVYTLNLANRGLYVLQDHSAFAFSTTYSSRSI
ncbi:hypothetical protein MBANPS3_010553 [Mucor bainieri]